jgi:DNA-binding transcriptional regulator LsrR (DeoR family)
LTEARELNVIEFRVNFPLLRDTELEDALNTYFAQPTLRVLNTKSVAADHVLQRLGRLASNYLLSIIGDNMLVGLTWGTSLYETVDAMPRQHLQNIKVVQVIGASGGNDPLIDGTDLARKFAEKVGGRHYYLHSPLIVENSQIRDAILSDPSISKTLELARQADLLITGIGTNDPQLSAQLRAGYVSIEELSALTEAGAVGEFCGYHINRYGEVMDTPNNQKVVGITVDEIRNIPHVIGVAAGAAKAPTILAALRGGLVNALIVDESAASEVLRLAEEEG